MMQRKFILLLTSIFLVSSVSVASAHTVLVSSNPSKGSMIKALPAKITLKFADPLLILGKRTINRVVVTDPDNFLVTTGVNLVKGAVLTAPLVNVTPITGTYKVSYRVCALDGHVVTGSFTFKLQG